MKKDDKLSGSYSLNQHAFGKNTFLILLIALVVVFLWMLKPFWSTLFMAVVLTALTYPLYRWVLKKVRVKPIASLATLSLLMLLLFIPMTILITLGYREALNLADMLEPANIRVKLDGLTQLLIRFAPESISTTFEKTLATWLQENPQALFQSSSGALKSIAGYLYSGGASLSKSLLQVALQSALCLLCMFYFFMDGPKIVSRLIHLSPLPDRYEKQLIDRFVGVNRATIRGTLVIGAMQGILGGLLLWILNIPSPVFWTGVMIFLSVIPAVGASFVLIPTALFLIFDGRWGGGIFLIIAASAISVLDNFLRPVLVGKSAKLHDLLIIFSTLGGIGLFGVIGLLLGPVIAAMLITATNFYTEIFKSELQQNAEQKE